MKNPPTKGRRVCLTSGTGPMRAQSLALIVAITALLLVPPPLPVHTERAAQRAIVRSDRTLESARIRLSRHERKPPWIRIVYSCMPPLL